MVPVDGLCTGGRGEDIPGANLGAGGVGFVGRYCPWKIEAPKEDDYKFLFYSILFFSAWLLFDVVMDACQRAGNGRPALSRARSSLLCVAGIRWAESRAAFRKNT